jgi:hypothetical protein
MLTQPGILAAAILALLPLFAAGLLAEKLPRLAVKLPLPVRLACPAVLCLPYAMVASTGGRFEWQWLGLYAILPVLVTLLLWLASRADPTQRGIWPDYLVLLGLGLAVDLRWFERAWPPGLAAFNKVLLLDAGLYGFLAIRGLTDVGFDLRLRWSDLRVGLRELVFYTPIALALGLSLGFLHVHRILPSIDRVLFSWIFTFVLIALPEEIFFRGWMQNLLERRIGRFRALLVTAILFGLSHFNKRAAHFNWRYVLLATLAGFFYGRAWRAKRRVGAAAFTHASVDTLWSIWLR